LGRCGQPGLNQTLPSVAARAASLEEFVAMRALLLWLALTSAVSDAAGLPERLSETGYGKPGLLAFSPQYPLWSDGTAKQRWLRLPQGKVIDATDPDAWDFPAGTRLFKTFAYGRPIETRVLERRTDGTWDYGVYVWKPDGSDALLAPPQGIPALPVDTAPGGRYAIPSRSDCVACHEGARVPVLGFSALQLSPERDPLALHADPRRRVDLVDLTRMGLLHGLPGELLETPPRIAARSPVERAALGYLHGNCGHCHGGDELDASVPVALRLAQDASGRIALPSVMRSLLASPGRYRPAHAAQDQPVVQPGAPGSSVLLQRVQSRDPRTQMPPLGTAIADAEGLALIRSWIESLSPSPPHH
jgi:hypothetical protein